MARKWIALDHQGNIMAETLNHQEFVDNGWEKDPKVQILSIERGEEE
jgi:hypothetical protein